MEINIGSQVGAAVVEDLAKAGHRRRASALLTRAITPFNRAFKLAYKFISWWKSPASEHTYYPDVPHKSKTRVLLELLYWRLRHGEFHQYYYMFGLDCVSSRLSSRMSCYEFCDFRNSKNMYLQNQEAFSTPFNYLCLMRDKKLFFQLATSLKIPVPQVLAIFQNGQLCWEESGMAGPVEQIESMDLDVICKPADGNCGQGVFGLKVVDGRIYINGSEATVEDVLERLRDRYLLQERLKQHPEVGRFHPPSINTLRLVTFYAEGAVRLAWAALRIGAGGGVTDNMAKGGVVVRVSPESGKLDRFGFQKPKYGRRISCHPDSGIPFEGFILPYFEEAVALVKKYHLFVPGIHSIGWDVAITPEGPVIIEGNDDWDGDLVMTIDPCFRTNFMVLGQYPKSTAVLKKKILKAYK